MGPPINSNQLISADRTCVTEMLIFLQLNHDGCPVKGDRSQYPELAYIDR